MSKVFRESTIFFIGFLTALFLVIYLSSFLLSNPKRINHAIQPKNNLDQSKEPISPVSTLVFICKGPQSKRFHYAKHCHGLERCSTKIFEVPLEEATRMGRTLCGYED